MPEIVLTALVSMRFYRFLTDIGAPIISLYLRRRLREGREDPARFDERLGIPSRARPEGKLVWCHAASVGEAMSVLSLVKTLKEHYPEWRILLTTGTMTSARMLVSFLPVDVIHQYVPVDRRPFVSRFLDHWRPDRVLWIESEVWPNLLTAISERHIPAALLNGRMSEKSFRQWSWAKNWAKALLSAFSLLFVQTEDDRRRFMALGARDVRRVGNLKFAAEPLPCDEEKLRNLRAQTGARKVWLMASTHEGEDEIALDVHRKLRARRSDLLMILVPRHPARGGAIAALAAREGLRCARRSAKEDIRPDTAVYLADTMGEMGLFYRLAPVTCLGGSFTWGGHNPIEPAQLGCAMIFGPRMTNFGEMAREMVRQNAALQVPDAGALTAALERLLDTPEAAGALAGAARAFAEQKRHVLDDTLRLLDPWFAEKRS